jgi:hypothetical protein
LSSSFSKFLFYARSKGHFTSSGNGFAPGFRRAGRACFAFTCCNRRSTAEPRYISDHVS